MMKKMILLLALLTLFACSSVKTGYDYDRQTDFTKYKTYSFTEGNLEQAVGQLNSDRIMKAVESELASKGMTMSDNPDALVDVHIKSEKKVEATATTTGAMGRWRYGYAGGFSTTQINYDEYTEGTMFISLIDKTTEKIVWQGTGTRTLDENANTEKRESNIQYAVEQILMNYPPKK